MSEMPQKLETEVDAQDWLVWALQEVALNHITTNQVAGICALISQWSNLKRDTASIAFTKDILDKRNEPPKEPWQQ